MFERLLKRDVRAQGASDAWGAGLTYRARRAEGARLGRGGFHRELAIGALCPGAWGGRAIPRTRRSWPRAGAGSEPVRFPSVRGKSMRGTGVAVPCLGVSARCAAGPKILLPVGTPLRSDPPVRLCLLRGCALSVILERR
jgi:hypothetical protein